MAEAKGSNVGLYFAIFLLIAGIMALVYLARSAAQGGAVDLQKYRAVAEYNLRTTGGEAADGIGSAVSAASDSLGATVKPDASWATYKDQSFGYKIRFPKNYRARLIGSDELVTAIPGETLLSGIVVAPVSSVQEATPDYAQHSLTLLITDWPQYGSSQNFLNEVYTNGTVPEDQIEKIVVGSRPALRLKVTSSLGGRDTTHTEIIVAASGTKVLKIIYWPAEDKTLQAVASTVSTFE